MARLRTDGAVLGKEVSNTGLDYENHRGFQASNTPVSAGTGVSVVSDVIREGERYSYRVVGANTYRHETSLGGVVGRSYYGRTYFRYDTAPDVNQFLMLWITGSSAASVRVSQNMFPALHDSAGTQHGSNGPALDIDRWYRLEMRIKPNSTAANGEADARIYDDAETLIWSETRTSFNATNTAVTALRVGNCNANNASLPIYLSSIAVNDDQGTTQNTWPGPGKTVAMFPVSQVNIGNWLGGAGATTNLQDAIDNIPPAGLSLANQTNSTQIKNATAVTGNGATFSTGAYTDSLASGGAGMTVDDIPRAIRVIARVGHAQSAARSMSVEGVSNPVLANTAFTGHSTGSGSDVLDPPVAWQTGSTPFAEDPTIDLGTAPQIRVKKNNATAGTDFCDSLVLVIDYEQVVIVSDPPVATTGSASLVFQTTSKVEGTVNPGGLETDYWVEYGATTSYGSSTTPVSAGDGTGDVDVDVNLSGLTQGALYHYRIVAENSEGISYGEDGTFTTDASTSTLLSYGFESSESPTYQDVNSPTIVTSPVHSGTNALRTEYVSANVYRSLHVDSSGLGTDAVVADEKYYYEGWFYFTAAPSAQAGIAWWVNESSQTVCQLRFNANRTLHFETTAAALATSPPLAVDTWHKWRISVTQDSTTPANGVWEFSVNDVGIGEGTADLRTEPISRFRPGCITTDVPGIVHDDVLVQGPSVGDVTPPTPNIVSGPTRSKVSQVSGKDRFDFSWSSDEDFQSYQVRVVPSISSPVSAGTLIEQDADLYRALVLGSNPYIYYRLNDSTTTAVDETENQKHGTYNAGTREQASLIDDTDGSATFDVNPAGVLRGADLDTRPPAGAYSVEAWVKPSDVTTSGTRRYITQTAGLNPYFLMGNGVGDQIQFGHRDNAHGFPGVTWATGWAADTTHHVVGDYDGTNLRLYADGALVAGPTAANTPNQITAYIGSFGVGSDAAGSGGFDGSVDEFAFYKRSLSAAEVLEHYEMGLTEEGKAGSVYSVTITDDELIAGAAEGNNIIKFFVQDLAGNWSE